MIERLNLDAAKRGGGAVLPLAVERIVIEKDQRAAKPFKRLFQLAHFGAGMQPRVDAEAEALFSIVLQPQVRRFADQIAAGENCGIDLFLQLGDRSGHPRRQSPDPA